MESATSLQLVGRVTYYLAWMLALCGTVVHFGVGAEMFRSMGISPRNLLEGSVLFFLISTVSVLRAGASLKPN